MICKFFVWLHRWTGLALAGFLILEGLTGSLLAFNTDLTRFFNPRLFAAPPSPDAPRLDLAALAERAEALAPQARVAYFFYNAPDQVEILCVPRNDPATGKPFDIGFAYLVLDPWTGKELGRLDAGQYSHGVLPNVMPFVYDLHRSLALAASGGAWVLGVVALVWTLDCFNGFYLTLPLALGRFWRRWKPSWLVKQSAGFFRLNFDLHRASGLWLWPMLLIFGWSSVMFNLNPVYEWVTNAVFDNPSELDAIVPHPNETPRLGWRAAQAIGDRLMEEQAGLHGFAVGRPSGIGYEQTYGVYMYAVQGSRDIRERGWNTSLWLDGDTGELKLLDLPTGAHSGETVSRWLYALHFADVRGLLAYRIFVCALGLVIVMLSVTGVYIWWKKRRARQFSRAHRGLPIVREAAQAYAKSSGA